MIQCVIVKLTNKNRRNFKIAKITKINKTLIRANVCSSPPHPPSPPSRQPERTWVVFGLQVGHHRNELDFVLLDSEQPHLHPARASRDGDHSLEVKCHILKLKLYSTKLKLHLRWRARTASMCTKRRPRSPFGEKWGLGT